MKKWLLGVLIAILVVSLSLMIASLLRKKPIIQIQDDITTYATIHDGDCYIFNDNKPTKTFIKGVNIGATKPGYFPGELGITKDDYLRWFRQIAEMNANTIRVYTTMKPDFYDSLYEFNIESETKLYVMHGVWLNEDLMKELGDPYAEDELLLKEFIQDGRDLVDIFHGNKTLESRPGFANGVYTTDVSQYIIRWI